jgi:hypothetical protein
MVKIMINNSKQLYFGVPYFQTNPSGENQYSVNIQSIFQYDILLYPNYTTIFLGEKSLQVLALPDFDGFDVRDVRSWEIVEGMSPPWAKKLKNCFQRWTPLFFPKKSGFPGICVPSLGYSSVQFFEKG